MIFSDEASVKKHIKTEKKFNIYLIYGDESYLNNYYASSLASSITDTSGASFNYHTFDSETISFDALYEACETLPVMSDKLCITVKDFNFVKTPADELEKYTDYLKTVPDTAAVIFLMSSVEVDEKQNSKWKPIIELFKEYGAVICLSKRRDGDIAQLLVRSAAKRNTSVSVETASYFISVVGNDMQVLLNEFDKVCALSGGNEITEQMINAVAVKSVEASVFDITKSVLSGQNDRAFEILSELIKNKEEPVKIIGALTMEYVDMYRAKTAEINRKGNSEYLRSFGSYKGRSFRLDKAKKSAAGLSEKQLKECITALSEADIKIKSFSVDNYIVIEELLAKLIYITGKKK